MRVLCDGSTAGLALQFGQDPVHEAVEIEVLLQALVLRTRLASRLQVSSNWILTRNQLSQFKDRHNVTQKQADTASESAHFSSPTGGPTDPLEEVIIFSAVSLFSCPVSRKAQ